MNESTELPPFGMFYVSLQNRLKHRRLGLEIVEVFQPFLGTYVRVMFAPVPVVKSKTYYICGVAKHGFRPCIPLWLSLPTALSVLHVETPSSYPSTAAILRTPMVAPNKLITLREATSEARFL